MAQLDILLIIPFLLGLIPILLLHYIFILHFFIPLVLGVRKMRSKKLNSFNF